MLKNAFFFLHLYFNTHFIYIANMEKKKVLFIFQEITPYLPENIMSKQGRHLPQGIQERKKEIRTFMPRYGTINERRYQLHEVIRLSGLNLIIDENDHSLIIKVASIPSARMQVYFIDNEEYFHRKSILFDKKGKSFSDNDERVIFFARGVLETVKKLRWSPDIIHCHGWITSLIPLYIKKSYSDDPLFTDTKVVYSVYDDGFEETLNNEFKRKSIIDGVKNNDIKILDTPNYENLSKLAINMSDAVVYGNSQVNDNVKKHIDGLSKPVLEFQSEDEYLNAYSKFYDKILGT